MHLYMCDVCLFNMSMGIFLVYLICLIMSHIYGWNIFHYFWWYFLLNCGHVDLHHTITTLACTKTHVVLIPAINKEIIFLILFQLSWSFRQCHVLAILHAYAVTHTWRNLCASSNGIHKYGSVYFSPCLIKVNIPSNVQIRISHFSYISYIIAHFVLSGKWSSRAARPMGLLFLCVGKVFVYLEI